jgi:hypothetical protein
MSLILSGTDGLSDVDGTAATPAIRGTDANTGIFFGTDIIGFSEGGAECARFDSSGNFGIGGTPSKKLQVTSSDVTDGIRLYSSDTGGEGLSLEWMSAFGSNRITADIESDASGAGGNFAIRVADTSAVLQTRLLIDNGGNLGIGTTSPTKKLSITGTGNNETSGSIQTTNTNAGTGTQVGLWASNGTQSAQFSLAGTGYTAYGAYAAGNVVIYNDQAITLMADNASTGVIKFATGGSTERMRLDSSGNLLVGTTSGTKHIIAKSAANDLVFVVQNTSATNPFGQVIYFNSASPNDATRYFLQCNDSTAERATIRSNGGLANYSGNNVNLSDRREKTNFAPAGSYLDKICAIPVQTFNYIDQNMEDDGGLTLGVVAQDVQAVAPEMVMESNWGTEEEPKMRLSIYQTDLQYALMKCIQEQQALITTLTARITALESA